jgi:hypothetical protein
MKKNHKENEHVNNKRFEKNALSLHTPQFLDAIFFIHF